MEHLTPEQKTLIADTLRGTSGVYDAATAEEFGVSQEDLDEILEDQEIERCSQCSWWCESSELEDVDGEPVCEECRED